MPKQTCLFSKFTILRTFLDWLMFLLEFFFLFCPYDLFCWKQILFQSSAVIFLYIVIVEFQTFSKLQFQLFHANVQQAKTFFLQNCKCH